jgi:hypothetical protein
MPQCHRCKRVQATGELRRTSLGFLCRDNGKGSRCWTIVRELRAAARKAARGVAA